MTLQQNELHEKGIFLNDSSLQIKLQQPSSEEQRHKTYTFILKVIEQQRTSAAIKLLKICF